MIDMQRDGQGERPHQAIPYEDIDCEIRPLVRLLNTFPGITTCSSCAGHTWPAPDAGIVFVAASQADLAAFLAALPPLGWQGGFVANQAQWEALWVSLQPTPHAIEYTLHLDGYPQHVQRTLLGKVEASLAQAVARLGKN